MNGVMPPCLQELSFMRFSAEDFYKYTQIPFKTPDNDAEIQMMYDAFSEEFSRDFVKIPYFIGFC